MMAHQTPHAKMSGHGAAHHGTAHFWRQRLSALANIPLTLFLIIGIVAHIGVSHAELVAWLSQPLVSLIVALLILSMFYHARLGMQSVIDDYCSGAMRVLAFIINDFLAIGLSVAALLALMRIVFMGGA